MGRSADTRTTIINGFTILEISRVHSSRIHRGVKTKTLSRRVHHDRLRWWSLSLVNHRQSDFLLDLAEPSSSFSLFSLFVFVFSNRLRRPD